jgi:regulatory protein
VSALEDLDRSGLIDDERFAREVVRDQGNRRMAGDRAIRTGLRAKGVAPEVIEQALAASSTDEEGRALELARRRAGRMNGIAPEAAARRLYGLLVRRGFGPGLAREATRRALEELGTEGVVEGELS